jgi:methylmalonyl-CoA epimerase
MSDIAGLMKVNIRAESMEKAKTVFKTVLGAELLSDRGSNTIGDFDGAMYKVGDLVLDIMAPNDPDGRFAKSLEKRGEGLDSLCFRVESLEAVRQRLEVAGIKMINLQEFHGNKIGFVHPRDCCGVLLEFIEPAKQD